MSTKKKKAGTTKTRTAISIGKKLHKAMEKKIPPIKVLGLDEKRFVADAGKNPTIRSMARAAYKQGKELHIVLTPSKPVTVGEAVTLIRGLDYNAPSHLVGRSLAIAREMEKYKLVERNPTAPSFYRPTAKGEAWRDWLTGI